MPPPRRGRSRSGRGASFAPPELRGTLGTLLRTTLAQASAVRDALERGAREGRSRIDDLRHERRRQDALAELGEIVLERVRRGELTELEEAPEAAEVLAALEDMDRQARRDDPGRGREWFAPKERSRFDRARGDDDGGAVSSASWTPPAAKDPEARVWRPDQAEQKKGGIVFSGDDDEDDDLADYMHPDDVPPKT